MSESASAKQWNESWVREDGSIDCVKMQRDIREELSRAMAERKGDDLYEWLRKEASKVSPAFKDIKKLH